ncbi:hypothetical protein B0H16DRAFT_1464124 [Mycena metata]|uniref:Uncharacterized protein n=1 Tax=Mycena metata TaxID=1033252 RepID=A0AAD7N259_9AGAR|nr:hypothetical protein B0H16DRAFT_1464124 [Mycena metata]
MPASTAKHPFTAIWLHPIPEHLSIKEFSAKIEAQTDSLLALPSAQTNILKYDLMIPNNKLDIYFKALGFPEPRPVVLAKIECEGIHQSAEHCAQFLVDTEVIEMISTAPEFAGASIFSMDTVTKIDSGSDAGGDACIGIFKCPPHLSRAQFHEFVDKASDGLVALPTVQKNIVKQTMWIQNDTLEKDVQAADTSAAETVAVFMIQAVWTDDGLREYFAKVDKPATNEYSNRFSVEIVHKLFFFPKRNERICFCPYGETVSAKCALNICILKFNQVSGISAMPNLPEKQLKKMEGQRYTGGEGGSESGT